MNNKGRTTACKLHITETSLFNIVSNLTLRIDLVLREVAIVRRL